MKYTALVFTNLVAATLLATIITTILNHDLFLSVQLITIPALLTILMIYLFFFFQKKKNQKIISNISLIASLIWMLIYGINYFLISNEITKWTLYFWSSYMAILFGTVQFFLWFCCLSAKLYRHHKLKQ